MRRAGRVADEAVVRRHADQHGVAFHDRSLAPEKGQPERLRQRVRHQERLDLGYLHGELGGKA
jgi:hypothetical protein